MTLFAYQIPLDKATQERVRGTARRQTDDRPTLQAAPTTTATGAEATTRTISGAFGGDAADELAESLEELGNPPDEGYGAIPVYGDGSDTEPVPDGYYVVRSAETEPVEPSAFGPLARYDAVFESAGSRQSQWRAVETTPTALDSDFGTNEEPFVGIPAAAEQERYWYDVASGDIVAASSVGTTTTEFGDVTLYDPTAPSITNPTLLYDLPYVDEGDADVVLWDRHGNASRTDSDGIVQWQRVFSRSHEFDAGLVLSNRRIRITIDASQGSIGAEEYTSGTWSDISLGSSSWIPVTVDVAGLDPAVVQLQVWFRDTSTGDVYTLDARLRRGADGVVWSTPENQSGATPQGLLDLLEPTASSTYEVAGETTTLVARREVRR